MKTLQYRPVVTLVGGWISLSLIAGFKKEEEQRIFNVDRVCGLICLCCTVGGEHAANRKLAEEITGNVEMMV